MKNNKKNNVPYIMNVQIKTKIQLSHYSFRVNPSLQIQGLLCIIRGYIIDEIKQEDGLYLFYEGRMLHMTMSLSQIKKNNEALIFELMRESVFGNYYKKNNPY